ncbi:hypothetical protein BU23DRAFT_494790 [Bimuria novae-zelandiae CBS 107.79]|uniref:Uncharacterized protein n=1 Tax=Bimuria novae-zelandiae CBS 107.79 TaxID=1447943 RepID=A0A6A5US75_9PLEO|nr:hypothetical protein BU23DRAFT_494790 [Bimuria novae-zelandiae CBS 107.79]
MSLPGDPSPFNADTYDSDDGLLSYEEWQGLPLEEKESWYKLYEADRRGDEDTARRLSSHLYFRKFGCVQRELVHPRRAPPSPTNEPPEKASALGQLDEAVKKLTHLAVLEHQPGFMFEMDSISRWRKLRFNLGLLICDTQDDNDQDMEALQLSIILSALGWGQCRVQSMDLYIGGPAFWSADRLRDLWQGEGHARVRGLRTALGDAKAADEEVHRQVSELSDGRGRYARQLFIMETTFTYLTHIDLSISEDDDESFITLVDPLFEFLCCCEKLETARFVFGRLVDGVLLPGSDSEADGPKKLLALLAEKKPWRKLRTLELEVPTDEDSLLSFLSSLTTLRRLALSNLTLLRSGGFLTHTILRIANCLELDSLEISNALDYSGPQNRQWKLEERTFNKSQLLGIKERMQTLSSAQGIRLPSRFQSQPG